MNALHASMNFNEEHQYLGERTNPMNHVNVKDGTGFIDSMESSIVQPNDNNSDSTREQ